jgi:UDP-N-acetyl-D-mannosaminuronate dehydrogenase
MRISVVGLGKLGTPLAVVLAAAGHDVIGVDTRPDIVASVNDGRSQVEEPGLADPIAANRSRLRATTDAGAAAAETDVTSSSSRPPAHRRVPSPITCCSTRLRRPARDSGDMRDTTSLPLRAR